MPVNSTHPDYDANLPAWLRARDVIAGDEAVKSAGEKYLPRLDCQDDKEFLAYTNRASFFNATAHTAFCLQLAGTPASSDQTRIDERRAAGINRILPGASCILRCGVVIKFFRFREGWTANVQGSGAQCGKNTKLKTEMKITSNIYFQLFWQRLSSCGSVWQRVTASGLSAWKQFQKGML